MMAYGFKGLVTDFLSTHHGHHVNPKRVNGSAVETIFGQLKHTTSGNLTGRTYETAKATLLTKRQVQGGKSKDDYRDTPLNIRQSNLLRKRNHGKHSMHEKSYSTWSCTLDCFLTANDFSESLNPTFTINHFVLLDTLQFSESTQKFVASGIIDFSSQSFVHSSNNFSS